MASTYRRLSPYFRYFSSERYLVKLYKGGNFSGLLISLSFLSSSRSRRLTSFALLLLLLTQSARRHVPTSHFAAHLRTHIFICHFITIYGCDHCWRRDRRLCFSWPALHSSSRPHLHSARARGEAESHADLHQAVAAPDVDCVDDDIRHRSVPHHP